MFYHDSEKNIVSKSSGIISKHCASLLQIKMVYFQMYATSNMYNTAIIYPTGIILKNRFLNLMIFLKIFKDQLQNFKFPKVDVLLQINSLLKSDYCSNCFLCGVFHMALIFSCCQSLQWATRLGTVLSFHTFF